MARWRSPAFFIWIVPVILTLLVVCEAFLNPDLKSFAISFLIGVFGLVLGWLVGMLAAPYDNEERQEFSSIRSGLIGLISGYGVAKIIDPLVERLFDSKEGFVFNDELHAANLFIFLTCAILGMMSAFVFRRYIRQEQIEEADQCESQYTGNETQEVPGNVKDHNEEMSHELANQIEQQSEVGD